jgi:transposase
MNKPDFFVGIDIASRTFTAAVGHIQGGSWQIVVKPKEFQNNFDSFPQFLHWLQQHHLTAENCVICMEATGVYNEVLAHFLVANHYHLAIQPPLEVKKAFKPVGHKTDPVDSCQISEYAYRYFDKLTFWQPRDETLEQIKVLLTTREQFTQQATAHKNAVHALKRKKVRTPLAEKAHIEAIKQLQDHIKELEQEIQRLIDQDPDFKQLVRLLLSIPGVGLLLAAHLLVLFESACQPPTAKQLSAYIGICPYEKMSGTSVYSPPTSRHYGPPMLRKLLRLAALSLRQHNPEFRRYYERKVTEGKPKAVALNNISNKLLKIICAILRSSTPFIPSYRSVNPGQLKSVLTKS